MPTSNPAQSIQRSQSNTHAHAVRRWRPRISTGTRDPRPRSRPRALLSGSGGILGASGKHVYGVVRRRRMCPRGDMTKRRLFTRLGVAGILLAVAGTLLIAPPAQSMEASLAATNGSSWQTNSSVQGIAVAAGTAYAGGRFTSVRPPGAAAGTGEVGQAY